MNEREWVDYTNRHLTESVEHWRGSKNPMAQSLVDLAELMDAAPASSAMSHDVVDATLLADTIARAKRRVLAENMAVDAASEFPKLLLGVAAQIAAIDQVLQETRSPEPPYDANAQWRYRTERHGYFLIPRLGAYRPRSSGPSSPRVKLKRRDLMEHHRLLRTSIGGIDVRLHWKDMAGEWPTGLKLAGVVFPNLALRTEEDGSSFRVVDVDCEDLHAQVRTHVEAAHREQCAALVFPELTITPAALKEMRSHLAGRLEWSNALAEPSRPMLSVAGSWHEAAGDKAVNVATVLDAYGDVILRHEKLLTFTKSDLRKERIKPGDVINVLATEQALIAFGICLDFCERDRGTPFGDLDVDYVLVPSFGGKTTMEGHIETAREMRKRFRTRCMVVQQPYPDLKPDQRGLPLGYVLCPSGDLDLRVGDTLVYTPWTATTAG